MKSGLFASLLALSGCELIADIPASQGFEIDSGTSGDADLADSTIDSDGCEGAFVRICVQPSASDLELGATLDTGTAPECTVVTDPTAGELCVIGARSINLAAGITLAVTGTRPLVLLASTTITIDGTLSLRNSQVTTGCALTAPTGISGGAGGSRGGKGGKGGDGNNGVGGVASAATPPSLLGGCPGGPALSNAGPPGVGGGSVSLIARSIFVTGTINASGTGGGGATATTAGGAGGGSGGVIVLDAPGVTVMGTVLAAGGGGGEGGRGQVLGGGGGGNSGASPNPLTPTLAAAGGTGLPGGDGGAGGGALVANGTDGGRSGLQVVTGGGGGGGAGIVVITAMAPTLVGPVVPAPTP